MAEPEGPEQPEEPAPPVTRQHHPKRTEDTLREAAKMVIEGGGTQAMAAAAAGVAPSTVQKWVETWEADGWRRPITAAAARTEMARDVALGRWVDHRERVGLRAGLMAERILGRIAQLLPKAGESEVVIEQAFDAEGNPTGLPRHRLLTAVPSVEVQRLAEAMARLWVVADKSAGLDNGIDISVTHQTDGGFAETTDDRMKRVLDVFESVALEDRDTNGNGRH